MVPEETNTQTVVLHAAFNGSINYKELGIEQNWDDIEWAPIHVDPSHISIVYENTQGNTNIIVYGDKWTVKEPVELILEYKNES